MDSILIDEARTPLIISGPATMSTSHIYREIKPLVDAIVRVQTAQCNDFVRDAKKAAEIILEKNPGPALTDEKKRELAERKNGIYRESLGLMSEKDLSDEVRATLDALRARGLKLAIGSSSKNTPFILERIGLKGYFDAVSDGNNITRSKPDPEVFLKAAEFLGLPAESCIVVEDAVSGAQAGHAAGMRVACLGDASDRGAGDWNLKSFGELLTVAEQA